MDTKLIKINERIQALRKSGPVEISYHPYDNSIQAEVRLGVRWDITIMVDTINYPNSMDEHGLIHWSALRRMDRAIESIARLAGDHPETTIKINARTKNAAEKRSEAKTLWLIEQGKKFLAAYRKATAKSNLARARKQIAGLQAQQKPLISQLRAANSAYLAGKRTEREDQKARNAEALKTGRFWEADHQTLKDYFHPPFARNYVAGVSERWRAALVLECKSHSYKTAYGNWGHKLVGTGRGYLCGIDDNGDEWGHVINDLPQSHDDHGNALLDTTVEEAMAEIFRIGKNDLDKCTRQGDLLFCPATIPTDARVFCSNCGRPKSEHYPSKTRDGFEWLACYYAGNLEQYQEHIAKAPVLTPAGEWEPRESHRITSNTLSHNGVYFRADSEITVSHTSHATVTLPAGEYRLYMSSEPDAD